MTDVLLTNDVIASQYLQAGINHFKRNEFGRAIIHFEAAQQLDPNNTYARYNKATALLSLGFYAQGFQEYEATWRLFHWRGFGPVKEDIDRLQALPLWRGEFGVRLLVYHEMGFGDAIMAMRYLPELTRRTDPTLVIDPALARLARSFDVEVEHAVPNDLREYDFRLPLFGVMAALHETTETIPAEPYLLCGKCKFAYGSNKIGIAWSGRTQTAFTLERFLQLFDRRGFQLYSLQPGRTIDGVEPLPLACDFVDVADRIAQMAHIVCVDTAAIHLAGAMGHPSAHLVLPFLSDWRWHRTELWYPRLHTYRQDNASDWNAPFARLNETLRDRDPCADQSA
jgi:tetratricopeptide (TPR) repeat protein